MLAAYSLGGTNAPAKTDICYIFGLILHYRATFRCHQNTHYVQRPQFNNIQSDFNLKNILIIFLNKIKFLMHTFERQDRQKWLKNTQIGIFKIKVVGKKWAHLHSWYLSVWNEGNLPDYPNFIIQDLFFSTVSFVLLKHTPTYWMSYGNSWRSLLYLPIHVLTMFVSKF